MPEEVKRLATLKTEDLLSKEGISSAKIVLIPNIKKDFE